MGRKKNLAPKEAARRLKTRLDSVYSLIWAGKLEAHKIDGKWRIPVHAVEQRARRRSVEHGTVGS